MVGHATNTDGTAAAKAADLARTEAESPFYTTKQGRAGAGHLLIDFRLHGKHWVLGGLYRSTVGFFFANENRRAKTHATTAETRRRQTHRPPTTTEVLGYESTRDAGRARKKQQRPRPGSYPRKKGQKVPQKHPHTGCVGPKHRDDLPCHKNVQTDPSRPRAEIARPTSAGGKGRGADTAKEKSQRPVTTCCEERPGLVVGL